MFQPLGYQYINNKPSAAHGTESAHVAIARSSTSPPDGDAEFDLPLALVLVADELLPLRLWPVQLIKEKRTKMKGVVTHSWVK
jgi:hypothetical protein